MEKGLSFVISLLNSIINFVVGIVLFIILLYIGFVAWDNYSIDANADMSKYSVYKPTQEDDFASFDELRKLNNEVVGWITLNNTVIDFPVVQGDDNLKYINTNVEGEYSLSGSIFLDYRNSIDPLDPVSIIYGHDMSRGRMFGNLSLYKDKDYMVKHKTGNMFLGNKNYPLEVIAFVVTDAYDSGLYNTDVSIAEMPEYLSNISSKSLVVDGLGLDSGTLLLLSTCNSSKTNGRSVLVCKVGV